MDLSSKMDLNISPKAFRCTSCETDLIPEKIYERKHCLCPRTTFVHFDMIWMYIEAFNIEKIIRIEKKIHTKILNK